MAAIHPGGGRPHLRDEDQSQGGGDCAVGMEEEEEESPVWVQRGNQHKPECGGRGILRCGQKWPLTPHLPPWLSSPAPALPSVEVLGGVKRALFLLPALSRSYLKAHINPPPLRSPLRLLPLTFSGYL